MINVQRNQGYLPFGNSGMIGAITTEHDDIVIESVSSLSLSFCGLLRSVQALRKKI
jgi:hypothetical protein